MHRRGRMGRKTAKKKYIKEQQKQKARNDEKFHFSKEVWSRGPTQKIMSMALKIMSYFP